MWVRSDAVCRVLRALAVDGALRRFETFCVQHLDGVGSIPNEPFWIFVGGEIGEHPVGERARVTASGTPHADPDADKLRRAQVLCATAPAVAARLAPPPPPLQPPQAAAA